MAAKERAFFMIEENSKRGGWEVTIGHAQAIVHRDDE